MEPDNKAAAQAQVRGSAQFVRAAESAPAIRHLVCKKPSAGHPSHCVKAAARSR